MSEFAGTPKFRSQLYSALARQPIHATSLNLSDSVRKMSLTCQPPGTDGEDGVRGQQSVLCKAVKFRPHMGSWGPSALLLCTSLSAMWPFPRPAPQEIPWVTSQAAATAAGSSLTCNTLPAPVSLSPSPAGFQDP